MKKLTLIERGWGYAYGFKRDDGSLLEPTSIQETDLDLLRSQLEHMLEAVYEDDRKWQRKATASHRFVKVDEVAQ